MPAIRLSRVEIDACRAIVQPLKGSDVVRTEAKYDRHGIGKVLKIGDAGGYRDIKIYPGDIVIYNDSNAVDFPMEIEDGATPEQVECIGIPDILGVEKK